MNRIRKLLIPLLLVVTLLFTGCQEMIKNLEITVETVESGSSSEETERFEYEFYVEDSDETSDVTIEEEEAAETSEALIDPDGVYTTAEDVALYLHTYGVLPGNFITKNEARALGWEGGSLEEYAPGMCIGGDHFGNYEGVLPSDRSYNECDINTLGATSRGAERLVYSTDGYIYYTADHYETFELLYEGA